MIACSNDNFVSAQGRVRRVILIEATTLDGDLRVRAILAVQSSGRISSLEGTAIDFNLSIAQGINQIAYRVVGRYTDLTEITAVDDDLTVSVSGNSHGSAGIFVPFFVQFVIVIVYASLPPALS